MYVVMISCIFSFTPAGISDVKNKSVIPADISSCSKTQKLPATRQNRSLKNDRMCHYFSRFEYEEVPGEMDLKNKGWIISWYAGKYRR
jgi:hypothetical protein